MLQLVVVVENRSTEQEKLLIIYGQLKVSSFIICSKNSYFVPIVLNFVIH